MGSGKVRKSRADRGKSKGMTAAARPKINILRAKAKPNVEKRKEIVKGQVDQPYKDTPAMSMAMANILPANIQISDNLNKDINSLEGTDCVDIEQQMQIVAPCPVAPPSIPVISQATS